MSDAELHALPTLLVLAYAPRAEKARLVAEGGEDAEAWAERRIATASALAARSQELARVLTR